MENLFYLVVYMFFAEIISIVNVVIWGLLVIFFYQYMKNMKKIAENPTLPPLEINVSKQLKSIISEETDNIVRKINLQQLKSEIFEEIKGELNVFRENMVSFVDILEKKLRGSLPEIKLPDFAELEAKFTNFKLPDFSGVKEDIKNEINNAFTDANVEKIANQVLKSLAETMKGDEGKEAPAAGMPDLANLDLNNIIKMFAMQYLSKFMGGFNLGGQQQTQNITPVSRSGF